MNAIDQVDPEEKLYTFEEWLREMQERLSNYEEDHGGETRNEHHATPHTFSEGLKTFRGWMNVP